jgi:hypothetical protein
MNMTRFYISWHTPGAVHTRCFESSEGRDKFRRLIDCRTAGVKTWEA